MRYLLRASMALVAAVALAIIVTGFVWVFGAFVIWDVNWFDPVALRVVAAVTFSVGVIAFAFDP